VQFATFAVPTISGEIKRHFRDRGWMVRVPRELQELNTRLVRAREALTRELGRSPTLDELADRAGATTERVVEAISAGETYRVMSLDEPLAEDGVPTLDVIGGATRTSSAPSSASCSTEAWSASRPGSARSSACASTRASPSARSLKPSESRRCTSPA